MADRDTIEVLIDDVRLGGLLPVGSIRGPSQGRTDKPASFEYHPDWLHSSQRFALDPGLQLGGGEQYPAASEGFGVFLDSSPDRWGRLLMERREALAARREARKPRALGPLDYLLGVNDRARTGALRFRRPGGPFLDDSPDGAPPVARLHELEQVALRIEDEGVEALPEYDRWLASLVAPGTSLGGARPKASFMADDGTLGIAKFPARQDTHDWGAWEHLVHTLARRAGIEVPPSSLRRFPGSAHGTFCVSRFDREGGGRRMFASAMTLLARRDQGRDDPASYLDLAEFISDFGAKGAVNADLAQLFRRVAFNVLVANRDDHLRNHGFLLGDSGWRLSPAFDMNASLTNAEHALRIDEHLAIGNMEAVAATAPWYRLGARESATLIEEVRDAVSAWESLARELDLPRREVERMRRAIDAARA